MSSPLSLVVTTYNWPEALGAVLESLRRQDIGDFNVIVADDGSGPATGELVRSFQTDFPVPLLHVWQPDEGPRVAGIRNRAIEASDADYIVFIDGDCLVMPDFIRQHRMLAEDGWFVAGKRSWLRPRMTARVLARPRRFAGNGRLAWLARSLTNQCTRPLDFLPLGCDRASRRDDWRQVQTCNLGVWRRDAVAVNGFDERYIGAGLEDSDFAVRLLRNGVQRKRGDHAAIVLHLDHARGGYQQQSAARGALFAELLASDRHLALVGLAQNRSTAAT